MKINTTISTLESAAVTNVLIQCKVLFMNFSTDYVISNKVNLVTNSPFDDKHNVYSVQSKIKRKGLQKKTKQQ